MKKMLEYFLLCTISIVFFMVPLSAQEGDKEDDIKKDEITTEEKKEDTEKPQEETSAEKKRNRRRKPMKKQAEFKKKTSGYTIGEIVVRSKALASVEDAAINTEVSSDSIKSRSEKTLDQALQTVPGVKVYQGKKGQ